VHVTLSPALAGRVPAGTPLYVLARDPTQPGPPFAAKRFAGAALPLDVVLTEQDSMMPGRTLKNAQQLVIVARYSTSGMPSAASGDLYGEVPYDLAKGRAVDLLIDKQVP
jgi:cytochrome c-type biogenesis protein CcmH